MIWPFRREPEPLRDGALVGVFVHGKGTVIQPHWRELTRRGPMSLETLEPQEWHVVPPEATEHALADAVFDGFARVRDRRRRSGAWGSASYADDLRDALGLGKRAALWKGACSLHVAVKSGAIELAPMRPEGPPGGFKDIGMTRHLPLSATAGDLAEALSWALQQAGAQNPKR